MRTLLALALLVFTAITSAGQSTQINIQTISGQIQGTNGIALKTNYFSSDVLFERGGFPFIKKKDEFWKISYRFAFETPEATDPKAVNAWAKGVLELLHKELDDKYLHSDPYSPKIQREFVKEVDEISRQYFKRNEILCTRVTEVSYKPEQLPATSNSNIKNGWVLFNFNKKQDPVPVFIVP